MTICAILIGNYFFIKSPSMKFKYATIGLLFVNVSIGGTLTHFAAPPVLMVASKWKFDLMYMLTHFGWKAAISGLIAAFFVTLIFLKEFKELDKKENPLDVREVPVPWWVVVIHLFSLAWTVYFVHHPILFAFGFLFFLGWCVISQEYQDEINIKPALLVGFFLAGLKVHGELQEWWIKPLIASFDEWPLFLGSTVLTAFNDNAAITYLSTFAFPEGFSPEGSIEFLKKYAVVAGAVTGGGLTVIANAPNPAGNSILKGYFGEEGVSPLKLFLYALPPTILAAICFMLL
jgi:Na+/H+ antiporter NhaD/arsenite permease-like protein